MGPPGPLQPGPHHLPQIHGNCAGWISGQELSKRLSLLRLCGAAPLSTASSASNPGSLTMFTPPRVALHIRSRTARRPPHRRKRACHSTTVRPDQTPPGVMVIAPRATIPLRSLSPSRCGRDHVTTHKGQDNAFLLPASFHLGFGIPLSEAMCLRLHNIAVPRSFL
jgi:hypothetical protein